MNYVRFIPIILTVAGATLVNAATPVEPANTSGTVASTGELNSTDAQFVQRAAEDSRREIQVANLTLHKGTDKDIKEFAQKIVDERTATIKKMEEFGRGNGLTMETTQGPLTGLAADISQSSRANRDGNASQPFDDNDAVLLASKRFDERLSKLEGSELDRFFLEQVIDSHQTAIDRFEASKETTENETLAKLLADAVPDLRKELESAQKLSK
ncbi:MAG: DUF4142 domain-containing protein [Bryobacteraceae bacterium]